MRIALDTTGGDFAPYEIVKGAYLAHKELNDPELVLIGRKDVILQIIKKECPDFNPHIVNITQEIGMDEPPALSIRRKRDSSVVRGLKLMRDKEIDAFVSCGNTGAMVCGATIELKLIQGVARPGIGLVFPTLKGTSFIIDVGANIDPKPVHLMQYALMAGVYSRKVLGKDNPKIALLNIGEEETKGTGFLKETSTLFKEHIPNFTGNIEPKDIFLGDCDCIIADGLAGNIALKVSEGFAEAFRHFLVSEVKKDILGILGLFLMKRSLKKLGKTMDYAEHGGAPLLGVNGVVIIGHGRSKAKAVKNAVKVAVKELERNINQQIEQAVNES